MYSHVFNKRNLYCIDVVLVIAHEYRRESAVKQYHTKSSSFQTIWDLLVEIDDKKVEDHVFKINLKLTEKSCNCTIVQ